MAGEEGRPYYTQAQFDECFQIPVESEPRSIRYRLSKASSKTGQFLKRAYCGKSDNSEENGDKTCGSFLLVLNKIFPFIAIMAHYDFVNWIANDLIAGFTVGVMHIPQGLLLCSLNHDFGVCF